MTWFLLALLFVAALPYMAAYAYATITFAIFPLLTRGDENPAPATKRERLRAWAVEGAAQAWAFLVSWMHLARSPRIICPGIGRPIILLPGYTETAGTLWILGRRLNAITGRPVAACNHRPSMYAAIEEIAAAAAGDIRRVCTVTGSDQADLVGHSMGGLVARYCAQRLGLAATVRAIVTLGTPHSGARLARIRTGRCTAQMIPGAPFLASLAGSAETETRGVRLASIGSLLDNIVQPVASAVGPRGEHVWTGRVAHVGLLVDAAVAREIARLLA